MQEFFSQTGPMKLSHIAEAALNQQMSSQRCHPHMAPIDTVGPDGPHPRVLKELNSVIAPALCGIFRTPLQCGDTVPGMDTRCPQ